MLMTRLCPTGTAINTGASRSKLACALASCAPSRRSSGGVARSLRAVAPQPRVAEDKKWQLAADGTADGTPFDTQMRAPGGDTGVRSLDVAQCDMDKFEAWWQRQHQNGALHDPNYPGNMPGSDPQFPGRSDVSYAFDLLHSWLPNEQAMALVGQRSPAVYECFCDHKGRPANVPESWNGVCEGMPAGHEETMRFMDPCVEAVLFLVLDIAAFAFGLAGLMIARDRYLRRGLVRDLAVALGGVAPDYMNNFRLMINELREANSLGEKVYAIFKILVNLNRLGGVKIILRNLASSMPWWQWLKASIIAVFVVGAWFGSDGVAFIAEAMLAAAAVEQLVEDCITLKLSCGPSTQPVPGKES